MPDVVSDEELNALAAEFVLGTLDYEERKGATALLEVDHAFRGIVRIWERRLGELHLMVEAVEPDPQVWARIKPKIPGLEQVELAIPSHVEAEAAPTDAVATADSVARSASGESDTAAPPETDAEVSAPAVEASAVEAESISSVPEVATPDSAAPAVAAETPLSGRERSLDETELRLNELAALLPPAGQEGGSQPAPVSEAVPAALDFQPESPPIGETPELLRAPEPAVDEFVPPPPMPARSSAPRVEMMPVRKGGRGWMAATLVMGLVAVALAALIGAWRYFPERLPEPLQVDSVLNLPAPPPPIEPPPPPPPPAFDE